MQKDQTTQYFLRPLWIGLEMQRMLYEALKRNGAAPLIAKIKELECNALILGGHELEQISKTELNEHLREIKPVLIQEKIKCIVKSKEKTDCDYLFWISQYSIESPQNHQTFSEILQDEIREAERLIDCGAQLIFYLPFNKKKRGWNNPHLLRDLCLAAGKKTALAFSVTAGHPAHDHLHPHPFFEQLRIRKEKDSTPLLPIINSGSLCQGDGLWPSISFDLFDSLGMRDIRRQFSGFISMTNHFPADQGFLHCNLWVAGQIQVKFEHPDLLIETWFLSKRPDVNYFKFKEVLKRIRGAILDLSHLRHFSEDVFYTQEEKRLLMNYLVESLKIIHLQIEKAGFNNPSSLQDQIHIFIRDVKRILLHLSHAQRIDITLDLEEKDLQDSFWTKILTTSSSSPIRDGNQISILEKPTHGPSGSPSCKIYQQTIARCLMH